MPRILRRNTRTSTLSTSKVKIGQAMWRELRDVFLFWIEQGVEIFRVDNPHTKAFPFWEWVIAEVKRQHPQALFLSEAFTRPKVMYRLGKLGFSQSYTYFPWRHTKEEIIEYFTVLTQTKVREYFRPNHWPNTPDILTEFLQTAGRSGFMMRFLLASFLHKLRNLWTCVRAVGQRTCASWKRGVPEFREVRNSSLGFGESEQPGRVYCTCKSSSSRECCLPERSQSQVPQHN